jgi:pteridine reductase
MRDEKRTAVPAEGRSAIQNALKGKTALVTGAGKRIGRAIALALAEEGVHIVAHARQAQDSETDKVGDEVIGRGVKSWRVFADLEKPEEYEALVSRTLETAGSLDFVINNASLFLPETLGEARFESLSQHIQVNAWAPLVLTREFARLVGRGKIVNLLDTRILGYDRAHVAYILSKQMLASLTKMCAIEFAPGITVNAVAPGLILPPVGKDDAYLDRLASSLPLKRRGGPNDIADAVVYLLKSDFVTGQVIYVDGGRHLLEESNGQHPDQ